MRTIVEPKEHIDNLWGKQRIKDGDTYRMMRYVLRVKHEGVVLLHNAVTGQMVILDAEEAEAIAELPRKYDRRMLQLVEKHYLVPEGDDEHQQVLSIRGVLQKYEEAHRSEGITFYTILPTTACNARCYYCFEHGVKTETMTVETADDVASFIAKSCPPQEKVTLLWFGGEPLVARQRIGRICDNLRKRGILFDSKMITNGYLFDEELIKAAKTKWNLSYLQISVDGTEKNYNEIKAFVNPGDNPYLRVLRNVEMLLNAGIEVGLRMNFDIGNYEDFNAFVDMAVERFGCNPLLQVYAYPVIGEYPNREGIVQHGDDKWFEQKIVELNEIARQKGVLRKRKGLPYLSCVGCDAEDDSSVVIAANGILVKCCEEFGNEQSVGTAQEGITNLKKVASWKRNADFPKCHDCVFFPKCVRLINCKSKDRCLFVKERMRRTENTMRIEYNLWLNRQKKGGN